MASLLSNYFSGQRNFWTYHQMTSHLRIPWFLTQGMDSPKSLEEAWAEPLYLSVLFWKRIMGGGKNFAKRGVADVDRARRVDCDIGDVPGPRLPPRRVRAFSESLPLPADASRAHRPNPQATTKPAPGPPSLKGYQKSLFHLDFYYPPMPILIKIS